MSDDEKKDPVADLDVIIIEKVQKNGFLVWKKNNIFYLFLIIIMDLQQLSQRAWQIANLYDEKNKKDWHKKRDIEQYMSWMVGDIGDLQKLIMAKQWYRHKEHIDELLQHELSDVLWSLLVIAYKLDIDLEQSFLQTMDDLEQKIK